VPRIENVGGILFVASAAVLLAGYFAVKPAQQYKQWAELGAIAGAGIWALGKLT
jgi:hypothetical protein